MPRRRRRQTGLRAGAAVTGLLLALSGASGRSQAFAPLPAPSEAAAVALGAYLDYGSAGVRRMDGLSRWLGGRELSVGHTYLPGDRWSNIEGRPEFLADWAAWRLAAPGRLLVLNVPMLERNEARVSDRRVASLLRLGAAGRYDQHFRTLASRLVELDATDTVLVLGWEMNGTTYTHRCAPAPAAWKAYWRRVVTVMRSVPGQRFRFDFAPNRGRDAIPWTECYPGDDVVDIIGMDSYDQAPGRTFEEQATAPYGLQKQVEFAAEHGKPISYPEWGLFRNGDNPAYMRGMLGWIARHRPLYQTITDYCPHGVWQCDDNPQSSKVFRDALFARADAVNAGVSGGPVDPPGEGAVPGPAANPPKKPAENPAENLVENPAENPVRKPVEKPFEKPFEKPEEE
ncbi:glycoside hydrolase family 26 protein [Streptomyces sp. NPDC057638]|uniref:glycoside hydrolase family 26 protein n=1 Tax=Streptomyces sp. NPDC057638 TaxID=3346190 RepID=UPI0036C25A0C